MLLFMKEYIYPNVRLHILEDLQIFLDDLYIHSISAIRGLPGKENTKTYSLKTFWSILSGLHHTHENILDLAELYYI